LHLAIQGGDGEGQFVFHSLAAGGKFDCSLSFSPERRNFTQFSASARVFPKLFLASRFGDGIEKRQNLSSTVGGAEKDNNEFA
jgi:hypothetical protein